MFPSFPKLLQALLTHVHDAGTGTVAGAVANAVATAASNGRAITHSPFDAMPRGLDTLSET